MPKQTKRRGRPSALARLSVTDLLGEFDRRRAQLQSDRDELAEQATRLDAEIAQLESLGGPTERDRTRGRPGRGRPKGSHNKVHRDGGAKRGRGRGGNEKSLPVLLHGLLRGKTMSVPDMAVAAKKAGHKSKSKNFRTIVSLAILNNRKMFKRVSRGQYTAK